MRVVFWGTPDFALPSLRALIGEGHDVVGVVTRPDRPRGRGRVLSPPPVKRAATEEGIQVLQPERAGDAGFRQDLETLEPELSVVVAYGQILPREVLDLPQRGSINVHASLLPELRGAAPINWAIIRGHERTGVTVMRMVEAMDAGPILFQVEEPIGEQETATDLWSRLSEVGAAALVESLALLEIDALDEVEQDHDRATFAPRLTREDAHVDWSGSARSVANRIRGMDAVPGAWTRLDGTELKVYRPLPVPDQAADAEPGTVVAVKPHDAEVGMVVACGGGVVQIREVKPAGKRRMTTVAWLRGGGAGQGDRLA